MTYRSRPLLDTARGAPCQADWAHNCNAETVVSSHRNEDKGMGLKRPDNEIAHLCAEAHRSIDEGPNREYARAAWMRAHWKTMAWLWENAKLTVAGSAPCGTARRAKSRMSKRPEAPAYQSPSKTVKHPGILYR